MQCRIVAWTSDGAARDVVGVEHTCRRELAALAGSSMYGKVSAARSQ